MMVQIFIDVTRRTATVAQDGGRRSSGQITPRPFAVAKPFTAEGASTQTDFRKPNCLCVLCVLSGEELWTSGGS